MENSDPKSGLTESDTAGKYSKLIVFGAIGITLLLAAVPQLVPGLKGRCGNSTCDPLENENSCPADCEELCTLPAMR